MHLTADQFWRFSLALYQAKGVKELCLRLQDEYALNVNLLLLCCQLDKLKLQLNPEQFAQLENALTTTQQQLIPLREQRRSVSKDHAQYQSSLAQELAIEKAQQADLISAFQTLPGIVSTQLEEQSNLCLVSTHLQPELHSLLTILKSKNIAFSEPGLTHGKIILSDFKAPRWAANRHVQTIWPRFFQRRARLESSKQRLELPDGDFLDLAWSLPLEKRQKIKQAKGMVILFHGLEGSINSHYANDMLAAINQQGWLGVLMHFRGCSGEANRLTRAYHSGETSDALYFINWLEHQYPNIDKVAVGFSLGGNMLLKLLAEQAGNTPLKGAVAVSAPLMLAECATSINQGFSRIYQRHLLRSMKQNLLSKMQKLDYSQLITEQKVQNLASFIDFDEHVTAPLHGFTNGNDYYASCSARPFLKNIQTPTLILHAKDDPFMNHNVIPAKEELSACVTLELSEQGGHVGFMQGTPWHPKVWMHQRILSFIGELLPNGQSHKTQRQQVTT